MMKSLTLGALLAVAAAGSQAATLTQGGTESALAQVFAENTGVTVETGDVKVDYHIGENMEVGDTFTGLNTLGTAIDLVAGTYDSFLIHFDTVAASGSTTQTFDFAGDIVGIIVSNSGVLKLLNDSDSVFGLASNTYEQTVSRRAETNDTFTLLDSNSLSATFRVGNNYIDNIRVITEVAPVPVPASLPLLLAGFGGLAALRSRRKS